MIRVADHHSMDCCTQKIGIGGIMRILDASIILNK